MMLILDSLDMLNNDTTKTRCTHQQWLAILYARELTCKPTRDNQSISTNKEDILLLLSRQQTILCVQHILPVHSHEVRYM